MWPWVLCWPLWWKDLVASKYLIYTLLAEPFRAGLCFISFCLCTRRNIQNGVITLCDGLCVLCRQVAFFPAEWKEDAVFAHLLLGLSPFGNSQTFLWLSLCPLTPTLLWPSMFFVLLPFLVLQTGLWEVLFCIDFHLLFWFLSLLFWTTVCPEISLSF